MRRRPLSEKGTPSLSLRTAALRLLGRRDYTRKELREKLEARGYPSADVARVISDLAAEGLQDDRRVAAAHIRTASAARGRGRLRIARELEQRGIDRTAVHELLTELAPEDELESIRRVLTRKRWPSSPTLDERRRMFQHLLRRGFSADAISKALRYPENEYALSRTP